VSFFAATPYDWSQAENNEVTAFYTDYLTLYRNSTALRNGALEVLTPNAEDALLYTRSTDDETMLIAVNIRDQAASLELPSEYQNQSWTDALSGESVSGSTLDLGPYGYRLLRAGQ
jgi:glycosidase